MCGFRVRAWVTETAIASLTEIGTMEEKQVRGMKMETCQD
jgi:hypothetical protein